MRLISIFSAIGTPGQAFITHQRAQPPCGVWGVRRPSRRHSCLMPPASWASDPTCWPHDLHGPHTHMPRISGRHHRWLPSGSHNYQFPKAGVIRLRHNICFKFAFGLIHTRSSFRFRPSHQWRNRCLRRWNPPRSGHRTPNGTLPSVRVTSSPTTADLPPTLTMRKKADIQAPPDHARSASCSSRR